MAATLSLFFTCSRFLLFSHFALLLLVPFIGKHDGCTINGGCICQWWVQPPLTNVKPTPFRVGCTCCPIIAISQQSPPLTFIWAIILLLLQHNLASCSSSKLTISRAFVAKFTGTRPTFQSLESPKHTLAYTKGSLQPDGLTHHI